MQDPGSRPSVCGAVYGRVSAFRVHFAVRSRRSLNASPLHDFELLHWLLALAPAVLFAQPPAQQPPSQTPPLRRGSRRRAAACRAAARRPATPAAPAAPKLAFTTPAGLLLVQVKPDQTAVFEELIAQAQRLARGLRDAGAEATGRRFKVYKAAEPMGRRTRSMWSWSIPRSRMPSTRSSTS